MHETRLLVALPVCLLMGCSRPGAVSAPPTPDQGPPRVVLVAAAAGVIERVVEQPGAVQPLEEAHLQAKLPAFVGRVLVDIGQAVKAEEVLAELSIPELDAEGEQKAALVAKAAAELEQARKAELAAQAALVASEALVGEARAGVSRTQALVDRWDSEYQRMAGLAERGVIDQGSRDEARNQARAAGASRDESRARVTSAEATVKRYQADLAKAKADVTAAQAREVVAKADARRTAALLSYSQIKAPFAGVVTARRIHPGDLVQPATGGAAPFTVARLDRLRVVLQVPEADAPLISAGQTVKLTVPALRPPEHEGKVARTSWALDPASRTLRAEIDLANPTGVYRPGLYVYARISTRVEAARSLPVSAVVKQGEEMVGYQVADGQAVRTTLRLGVRDGQRVELLGRRIGSGPWEPVRPEDQYIKVVPAGLADGAAVVIEGK